MRPDPLEDHSNKEKDMKIIAQIWMTFTLANIVLIGHVSDLNMSISYLYTSLMSKPCRRSFNLNPNSSLCHKLHNPKLASQASKIFSNERLTSDISG